MSWAGNPDLSCRWCRRKAVVSEYLVAGITSRVCEVCGFNHNRELGRTHDGKLWEPKVGGTGLRADVVWIRRP